jgi:hypothetical protein
MTERKKVRGLFLRDKNTKDEEYKRGFVFKRDAENLNEQPD